MAIIHLQNRAVLKVTGEDKVPFLQGILTNDVELLETEPSLYAMLLTPQGKVLYDMILISHDSAIWLDVSATHVEALKKRLTMYKLRSDVTIEQPDVAIYALTENESEKGAYPDPRSEKIGSRVIAGKESYPAGDFAHYETLRIQNGIPGDEEFVPGEVFSFHFNADALNAVSYTKGCYVGQEVVARSKHRGEIRKKLYVVEGKNDFSDESAIKTAEDGKAGTLYSRLGKLGLAVLTIEKAENDALLCDGNALKVHQS